MRAFAIGDLHLSATADKPMDLFGPQWRQHDRKIAENWRRTVADDDLVLIPGDLSWAVRLQDARPDLEFIGALPGQKFFIQGNHDYWVGGPKRVRGVLPGGMHFIRYDAALWQGVGIFGVRGWTAPWHPDFTEEEDGPHWRRAALRLELSLQALDSLQWQVAVAMFHFPPRTSEQSSPLTQMIEAAGVRYCVYGHLHGRDARDALEGERDGVVYHCVSADRVDFQPREVFSLD